MKEKFSFLKDPRALSEIRKHKWIESQKLGQEMGFASAAVDWVKKYGEAWKKAFLTDYDRLDFFVEKRRYRRFSFEFKAVIKREKACLPVALKDINLEAISCRVKESLPGDSPIEIILNPQEAANSKQSIPLRCRARILRVTVSPGDNAGSNEYNVVLMPNEECRSILERVVLNNLRN